MPQSMWKQCKVPGCPGLTRQGKYCEKHKHLEERDKRERNLYYNQNARTAESQAFYESPAWRNLRRQKLRQMPLCEICYAEGRIEKAVMVDHKIEIKDGGAALDIENLTSICHACHNKKTARERAKRNEDGGND